MVRILVALSFSMKPRSPPIGSTEGTAMSDELEITPSCASSV